MYTTSTYHDWVYCVPNLTPVHQAEKNTTGTVPPSEPQANSRKSAAVPSPAPGGYVCPLNVAFLRRQFGLLMNALREQARGAVTGTEYYSDNVQTPEIRKIY